MSVTLGPLGKTRFLAINDKTIHQKLSTTYSVLQNTCAKALQTCSGLHNQRFICDGLYGLHVDLHLMEQDFREMSL